MKNQIIAAMLLLVSANLAIMIACANSQNPSEPKTVSKVDLSRYLGQWHEIATIPMWFQKDCAGGTTATYALKDNGDVSVLNQCVTAEGKVKSAKGVAWVVDKNTNAKLKVSFFPFGRKWFAGDYWIIDLGLNYEYAVVGHPSRKYGWILSRTPELPQPILDDIVKRLNAQGYDFSKFKLTEQKKFLPLPK
jgi:apolipoprotein D and lipocalin family protein